MDWVVSISGAVLSVVPSGRLPTNRQWTVTVDSSLSGVYSGVAYAMQEDYTFWFTSAYCPLFTTLGRVKLEAGPQADDFLDDTIYRMINKNSMDVVEMFRGMTGINVAYDYWGCTWHNVPHVMKRYVECKTAYDLLALVDAVASTGGGPNQLKTLGDMTIRYGGGTASTADPNRKKQLYDCWQEYFRGLKAVEINRAVRGYYDATKGYFHPVWEPHHNRIMRPVDFRNSSPAGPWQRAREWSGWY